MEQQNSNNRNSIVISGDNNRTENSNNSNCNNIFILIEQHNTYNITIEPKKESKIAKSLKHISSDIYLIKKSWNEPREMVDKSLFFKTEKSLLKYIIFLLMLFASWFIFFKQALISLFIVPLIFTIVGSYYLKVTHNSKCIKRQIKLYGVGMLCVVGAIVFAILNQKYHILSNDMIVKIILAALLINCGSTYGLFINSFGGELPELVTADQEVA